MKRKFQKPSLQVRLAGLLAITVLVTSGCYSEAIDAVRPSGQNGSNSRGSWGLDGSRALSEGDLLSSATGLGTRGGSGEERNSSVEPTSVSNFTIAVSVYTLWDSESCPVVDLGGIVLRNGGNYSLSAGSYAAVAFFCYGFPQVEWSGSGGVSIKSELGNSSEVSVTGNGSLDVEYLAPKYDLTFEVVPATCPGLDFNGTLWPNGSQSAFFPKIFPIDAPACAGYLFSGWSTQSTPINNLTILCATPAVGLTGASDCTSTQARILGNSTLVAKYAPLGPPAGPVLSIELTMVGLTGLGIAVLAAWLVRKKRTPQV
jgi:hypothetical protein